MVQGKNDNKSPRDTGAASAVGPAHDFRRPAPLSAAGNSSARSEATSAIRADVRSRLDMKGRLEDKLVTGAAAGIGAVGHKAKSQITGNPQTKAGEAEYMEKQRRDMGYGDNILSKEQSAENARLNQMMHPGDPLGPVSRKDAAGISAGANAKAAHRAQVMQMVHVQNSGSDQIAGIKAGAVHDSRKAMEKEVVGRLNENLSLKQKAMLKLGTYAAGKQAVEILYRAAEEMAQQAERGGAMAFMMIALTYVYALIKDIIDIVGIGLPFWGTLFGAALGLIIAMFWLLICGSGHGRIDRFIVKSLLRLFAFIFLDGFPIVGLLPLFLLMNAWTHWDYIKAIRKAERALGEINDNITYVQTDVQRTINSI